MQIKKQDAKLKKLKPIIIKVLKSHNIKKAGVFGSYATGESKKSSDIDILIKPGSKNFSLLDLIGIEQELEDKLNKDVDLLTYKSIHPLLKKHILKEEVKIL